MLNKYFTYGYSLTAIALCVFGGFNPCSAQNIVETTPQELVENAEQSAVQTGEDSLSLTPDCSASVTCLEGIRIRPQDEIWAVDARNAHCAVSTLDSVRVGRFFAGCWQNSSLEELTTEHLEHPETETVLYIHGNQTNRQFSLSRGMVVYRNVITCGIQPPIRFVIFQWKSEREISSVLRDYLVKSKRAIEVGKTLALILREFQNRDMTVVGYSLGTQVVLSALYQPFMNQADEGSGYRLALIAPALDCDFVNNVKNRPSCGNQIDQTQMFFNKCDPALKWAEWICRKKYGRRCDYFDDLVCKGVIPLGSVKIFQVSAEVGKRHSINRYCKSATIRGAISKMIPSVAIAGDPSNESPDILDLSAEPQPVLDESTSVSDNSPATEDSAVAE